jgi:two-component system chemotaxis response regulator CheY
VLSPSLADDSSEVGVAAEQIRVLLVDDSEAVREVYSHMLARLDVSTVEAADGDAALAAYVIHRPDAVFLDIDMPGIGGIDVLRELRRLDPNARVAMLTAETNAAVVRSALDAGARDYLVKPVSLNRLRDALERLLA